MKISVGAGAIGAKISVFCQTQIQDKNIFHTSEHKNRGSDWSVKQHVKEGRMVQLLAEEKQSNYWQSYLAN